MAFSLPASVLAKIFVSKTFAKVFAKSENIFSRNYENENFHFNPISTPQGANTVKWGEGAQQGV
jgi:hypothetical protein